MMISSQAMATKHGVALESLGNIGHGLGDARLTTRQVPRQLQRPLEVAPLSGLVLRGRELEHQHGARIAGRHFFERVLDGSDDLRVGGASQGQADAQQAAGWLGFGRFRLDIILRGEGMVVAGSRRRFFVCRQQKNPRQENRQPDDSSGHASHGESINRVREHHKRDDRWCMGLCCVNACQHIA